jgi:hypothetical protein
MTIFGWDVSHYDATPNVDRLIAEGFSFMTHKAGGDANDAELASWWAAVKPKRGRLLLGAYWVLYPGSPAAKADAFLARLDSQCPGWRDGPFILQVDCEKWNGNSATVPPKSDIKAFCNRLVSRMPKLTPIVYGPNWVYGSTLTGLGYPLWASAYVTGSGTASGLYPGDTSSKWNAYSGQVPAILQFSSSATIAGQTTCDANAFRGTLAELTALLAPGWVENPMAFQDDFLAALQQPAVRSALGYAVWGYDPGKGTDGNAAWPGVGDPWHPGDTISAGSGLGAVLAVLLSKTDSAGTAGPVNRVAEIKALQQQLASSLNLNALTAAVGQAVADAIAALPVQPGGLTAEQIEAATAAGVRAAFNDAFGSPAT